MHIGSYTKCTSQFLVGNIMYLKFNRAKSKTQMESHIGKV